MTTGGVAKRMIRFANACIGHLRGGLAMAGVFACMLFAALSGSSPATVVAIGSIVIAGMVKAGYPESLAAGVIGNYNLLDAAQASALLQRPIHTRVAIRPEAIELGSNGTLEGEIRSHSLLGNVIRYRVQAHGVLLVVDVLNRTAADLLPDGQRVSLTIGPDALCAVA